MVIAKNFSGPLCFKLQKSLTSFRKDNETEVQVQRKLRKAYGKHKNLGYSRGNNLALKEVKTKYSLILNPDTVLEENTLNNFYKFLKKGFL